ncbi:hypothetical protein BBH88_04545 [Planococcus antarcticus DSM 14505]|uniref:DUF4007 domain-containing protein n=1 Tax=Planococcus antarcticus DSM 14505 TaxID=1185653 RepID=A0ABN4RGQ9_9BACL|nr:DUF4007 family protein [Planococcus antarcticus]ANU09616.1 hypothetical protein BBH88_04545 [Planococcus antarcticus DSM 14505]
MKYQLNFHQTFAPETEALAQLLRVASSNREYLSKEEISSLTMIPTGEKSGKVVPHIYYSRAMGLINFDKKDSKYYLSLTALGEVIYQEDPFLTEDLSKIICHCEMTNKYSSTLLWSYLFNKYIPVSGEIFSQSSFSNAVTREFDSSKVNLSPLRSFYTAERSFASLSFLSIENDKFIISAHPINRVYRFVYAYLLLKNWEIHLPTQSEITFTEITDTLGFGNSFVWNEDTVMEVLELLQDQGVVVVNRQLSPITIIKQVSSDYCLSKLYNFLI